tara:strand:+ start:23 stop:664 length:642 start_codon:yes stop_codon:yes gene_type:complete
MLNFQIRGYGLELCAGGIEKNEIKALTNRIRDEKHSLAKVMLDGNWLNYSDMCNISSSIVSNKTELIVTSYNSKNYYDDGFSFFRSDINELTQIPVDKPITVSNNHALIVNKAIYYGCTFEAEIRNHDHLNFDKNHLDISTITTPFHHESLLDEIFLHNSMLANLNRKKRELIAFQSTIYTSNSLNIPKKVSSDNFLNEYDNFLDSKIELKIN